MKKVTQYLHCEKCDISYEGEQEGWTDEQISNVIGAVYEVEFTIDAETGTILAVQSGKQTFNNEEK
jgi:hypothetical protein